MMENRFLFQMMPSLASLVLGCETNTHTNHKNDMSLLEPQEHTQGPEQTQDIQ